MRKTMGEYLDMVKREVVNASDLEELLMRMYSRLDVSGQALTGMPHSPNANTDGIPRMVIDYNDTYAIYEEQVAVAGNIVHQASVMFWEMAADHSLDIDAVRWAEMNYCHNMSYKEISKFSGKSVDTIRHKIYALLKTDGIDRYVPLDAA